MNKVKLYYLAIPKVTTDSLMGYTENSQVYPNLLTPHLFEPRISLRYNEVHYYYEEINGDQEYTLNKVAFKHLRLGLGISFHLGEECLHIKDLPAFEHIARLHGLEVEVYSIAFADKDGAEKIISQISS